MSNTRKYYLFNNFDKTLNEQQITKNELKPLDGYNITLENGLIQSGKNFNDYLSDYFTTSQYEAILNSSDIVDTEIIGILPYEYYDEEIKARLFMYDKNYSLFEFDFQNSEVVDLDIQFEALPKIIFEDGAVYLFSDDLNIMFYQDNDAIILPSLTLYDYVNYEDKMLLVVKENACRIYYTDKCELGDLSNDLDIYDYIDLRPEDGKIIGLKSLKNKLYVVQQYKISRIDFGNTTVTISNSCEINSKIYENTLALIRDYIIYFSESGIYLFDGNDIKQIFCNESELISKKEYHAEIFNNRYYLAELDGEDLFEFSIDQNCCNKYKFNKIIDFSVLATFNNYELLICTKNDNYYKILHFNNKIFNKISQKLLFNETAFDTSKLKSINYIKIMSTGEFSIEIHSDYSSVKFDVSGSLELDNLSICGNVFQFEVSAEKEFMIKSILIGLVLTEE